MVFPSTFVWGAAAASYQIEGAAEEDGRGLSVWDAFTRRPDKIYQGHTGDVACDHYHRYQEDVRLMREIGLQAYRLSLSWSRILPEGVGAVNEAGLDFYDRLIDELLNNSIQPWVTLFHWDFPLALYHRGSWLNRESVDWFAEYTDVVVRKLGDRVSNWMTLNEPAVFTVLGYLEGVHAPGDKLSRADGFRIAHHALMAHGRAAQIIRANGTPSTRVGIASNGRVGIPRTNSPADIEAARRFMFDMSDGFDLWYQNWWCDPIMFGAYPADGLAAVAPLMPEGFEKDLAIINQPFDFYGLNVYQGTYVSAGEDGKPVAEPWYTGYPLTSFYWHVTPECLYWGPRLLHERYQLPVIITENGLANPDWVHLDGKVHDPQRIDYTKRHLREFSRAYQDGTPIGGYFHWSILDNFEWAEGMKQRFGLIHVDYRTQERILKDSAYWYRDVIQSSGESLNEG